MTVPQSIQEQLQALNPSAIIELFTLELTEAVNGADLTYRWHSGKNELDANVVFGSTTYTAKPIDAVSFTLVTKGTLPRPSLTIGNVDSGMSVILAAYNLLHAKVTRTRTCVKFLDAVNFTGGVNSSADPNAKFDDDIYYIDRVVSENIQAVTFELTSKLEMIGLRLPRRQVLEHCPWKYRGTECGYKGGKYFDEDDNSTSEANDACGKRYNSCRIRFTDKKQLLPFGGFPGARIQI